MQLEDFCFSRINVYPPFFLCIIVYGDGKFVQRCKIMSTHNGLKSIFQFQQLEKEKLFAFVLNLFVKPDFTCVIIAWLLFIIIVIQLLKVFTVLLDLVGKKVFNLGCAVVLKTNKPLNDFVQESFRLSFQQIFTWVSNSFSEIGDFRARISLFIQFFHFSTPWLTCRMIESGSK